ncbi:MAG: hypothetical protein VX100_01210 [Pseudomonadota bacterium]|uniref:hypothetical protein n=1 Tax=Pseudoalteromonas spongiae TaxID=298657 RepID=UPI00110ACBEC|nr:hypothetical protein [Pseudoalteromonas spongiae]MEC8207602.1 hypothetical protein [Pseudomonadota bacterium]MEC8324729.1 hypothetical protein [Pseudomonadota bacterium]TMO83230.1 hypothetical protein CWC15_16085 [Pseudoalteromonas spongiae]
MQQHPKKTALSPEMRDFISNELKHLDSDLAKRTFYFLLLDKYAVPKTHALRNNPQHHLPVNQLDNLLREKGFTPSKPVKINCH